MTRIVQEVEEVDAAMKILLLITFLAIGETIGGHLERLIRGDTTPITYVPYYASLRCDDHHFCGGALITKRHVLTAAHCVANLFDEPYEELAVVTGADDIYHGGTANFVRRIDWPKEARQSKLYDVWIHDIAVVTLMQDIEVNQNQRPIKLPLKDPVANTMAVISGFGRTTIENPYLSTKLRIIRSKILLPEACQKFMKYELDENNICGQQINGSRVCNGDSGGPVVHDGTIVGIVSWFVPSFSTHVDVFTNVNKYLNFIKGVTDATTL